MDVGDYYSKSIESFRRNWNIAVPSVIVSILTGLIFITGFFGIFSVLSLNLSILGNITPSTLPQINPNALWTAGAIFIIMEILVFVIDAIRAAATVGMAKQIIREGSSNLGFAWKSGIKYSPKIIVVSIIRTVLMSVIAIPLILGVYFIFTNVVDVAIPVILIGSVIFIIGAILLSLIFFVFSQSIVVGQKSIIDSIKDSFHVFWDNKLTVFLVALINIIISFAVGILLGFVVVPLSLLAGPVAMQVINQVLGLLITIILVPYFALVMTYMYMDLKKGFADEIEV